MLRSRRHRTCNASTSPLIAGCRARV
jgi:hypothetical protein